jgi:ABC-type transporter lipoprotein component MlaA
MNKLQAAINKHTKTQKIAVEKYEIMRLAYRKKMELIINKADDAEIANANAEYTNATAIYDEAEKIAKDAEMQFYIICALYRRLK